MNSITSQPEYILIIDDEPSILDVLGSFLESEGYGIATAIGGRLAVEQLEKADFDLIITDLNMPGVTGFDVMAAAKILRPDTPLITLTGQGTLDNAVLAIKHGAYDFVTKPIKNLSVFLVTIQRALEKRRLLQAQRTYIQQIERQNKALLQDLAAARFIQACMIDHDFGAAGQWLNIVTRYLPAETIGGDFYDVFFLPPHSIGFYLADVAGHGVAAAMVTAFAKQSMLKIAEKVAEQQAPGGPSPKEILMRFNQEMLAQGFERDGVPIYLTVFLSIYDINRRMVHYTNGGHQPSPRCLSPKGQLTTIDLPGNPIGLFNGPFLEEAEMPFQCGDRLFLCSDGVIEAMDSQRLTFGNVGLDRWLTGNAVSNSNHLADGLVTAVKHHAQFGLQQDDISILILTPVEDSFQHKVQVQP